MTPSSLLAAMLVPAQEGFGTSAVMVILTLATVAIVVWIAGDVIEAHEKAKRDGRRPRSAAQSRATPQDREDDASFPRQP